MNYYIEKDTVWFTYALWTECPDGEYRYYATYVTKDAAEAAAKLIQRREAIR